MAVDAAVLGFLATYAIHSTLLLGLAWLASRAIPSTALALRGLVWRAAIFGGVATAGIQVATGYRAPFAHWSLASAPADVASEATAPRASEPLRRPVAAPAVPLTLAASLAAECARELAVANANGLPAAPVHLAPGPGFAADDDLDRTATVTAPGAPAHVDSPDFAARDRAWNASAWRGGGALAVALVLVLVSAGFGAMALRLSRRLRGAVAVESGPMRAAIDALAPEAFGTPRRVRLLAAPVLDAPLSFGLARPTICVPPRALDELSEDEQRALAAHELAHLSRRDPAWLSAAWLVEHAFFFQPLNRVARRELHDVAELACDAWAARRTGLRLALASCLARIATWLVEARSPLPATSMAGSGGRSRLARRVERLLDDAPVPTDERARPAARLAAFAAVGCAVVAAPGVSARTSSRSAPSLANSAARAEIDHHPSLAFERWARVEPPPTVPAATDAADEIANALSDLRASIEALQRDAAELRGEASAIGAEAADGAGQAQGEIRLVERRLASVERRCARLARIAAALQELPRAAAPGPWLERTGP